MRAYRGFSLVEGLVCLLLLSLVLVAVVQFVAVFTEPVRAPAVISPHVACPGNVTVLAGSLGLNASDEPGGWSYYERVPSMSAELKAQSLFADFEALRADADMVVVLGGAGEYPGVRDGGGHSEQGCLPAPRPGYFSGMSSVPWPVAATRAISTAFGVRGILPAAAFASNVSPGCFTVLFFRGIGNVIGVTECARWVEGGNALYAVQQYRKPKVNGVYAGSLQLQGYYRFFVPADMDVWALPAGAAHNWHRWDSAWQRYEEGPCRVVFPDPNLMAAGSLGSPVKPFSKYVFFINPWN